MTGKRSDPGGKLQAGLPAQSYEVGYGKPPKETRFRKGQSGNPKGRPKGAKNKAPALNGLDLASLGVGQLDGLGWHRPFLSRWLDGLSGDRTAPDKALMLLIFCWISPAIGANTVATVDARSPPSPMAEDRA